MHKSVNVHLLPELTSPERLAGHAVVVIDVLRASTTIVTALAGGAKEIAVCLHVDEARKMAAELGDALLGGERGGQRIEGFDLGNSPAEYTPQRVSGKTIVFTSTNGAKAMMICAQSKRVLIGAFVNFSALCEELASERQVEILCAGTDGEVTREDVLLAGAISHELSRGGGELNDQAQIATDVWRMAEADMAGRDLLANQLQRSQGGRNMLELGLERDVDIAAQIDKFDIVPEIDLSDWRIRAQ